MVLNQIVLDRATFDIMMNFAQENPRREIIGIIFGRLDEDSKLLITNAYPFRVGKRKEVHFIDEDYEKALPLIKASEKQNLQWIGWFHSHPFKPGDHLYMSSTDIRYHYPVQQGNQ